MSDVVAIPLVVERGDKVILYGWRGLSLLNIVAMVASFAAPFVAYFWVGWWLSLLAVSWLGYAIWAAYKSVLTEITFRPSGVKVHGKLFPPSDVESFDVRQHDSGTGMDDAPGYTEIWMNACGDAAAIALMTRHVDGAAIAALLNSKLESVRTPT